MVENLVYALKSCGENVKVVSLYNCNTPISERLHDSGIEVLYLGKRLGFDYSLVKKISRLVNEEKPDVLHSHLNVLPYLFFATRKTPIVHTLHSIASKEQVGYEKIICRYIYKTKRCTPVTISPAMKETAIREHGLFSEKIPVVYNGVDLCKFCPKSNYELHERINIVHVGSLIPLKNHILMLEAIDAVREEFPSVHLCFLGVGTYEERLRQVVAKKHLERTVEFVGLTSNVAKYLSEADAFILPSQYEGMPMSIIEAMGTGLPIIASRVGGIPDMIDDEKSGLLIEPTVEELIKALLRLLCDKTLRETIGTNALKKTAKFSSEYMAKKYVRIYNK